MRNDALARIKVACDSDGTVKTNVAKRCEALCKAGHAAESSVPPEMSAWARQFKDTLSKLKYEMKKRMFPREQEPRVSLANEPKYWLDKVSTVEYLPS